MGFVIGGSDQYSTWGRCRTPIFRPLSSTQGSHNLFTSNAFISQANTFFRASSWFYLYNWTDGSGNPQIEFVGPYASPGPGGPTPLSVFKIGSLNSDPLGTYSQNLLDDVEVQNYWVGRTVVIDSVSYTMDYSALDGVQGNFQSITPSNAVDSFDL